MKNIVEAKLEYNRKQLKKFMKARNKSAIHDYDIRCHLLEDIIEEIEEADKSLHATKSVCDHDFIPQKVWMHECLKCGLKEYEKPEQNVLQRF